MTDAYTEDDVTTLAKHQNRYFDWDTLPDWQKRNRLHRAETDLAAVAPAIAARALRDAAYRMPAFHDGNAPEWAITSACKWMRERADQIEASGEGTPL